MVTRELILRNGAGMHARPAAELTQLFLGERADVTIIYKDKSANVKSLLHVVALNIKSGDPFIVSVDGKNEVEILDRIAEFVESLSH